MNTASTMPPIRNTRGPGRTNPRTAIVPRITRNTTSGGMNPMLSMTLIVISASMTAAMGMSHIAVLLAFTATAGHEPASSVRVLGTVPSIAIVVVLRFGLMSGACSGTALAPSGGLPSRVLRGYCP